MTQWKGNGGEEERGFKMIDDAERGAYKISNEKAWDEIGEVRAEVASGSC